MAVAVRVRMPTCESASYDGRMPKTVQVRDVDDDVYDGLVRHAAAGGVTVPELLRQEMARLANRPTVEEWLARTRRRPSTIERRAIVEALDDLRGPYA